MSGQQSLNPQGVKTGQFSSIDRLLSVIDSPKKIFDSPKKKKKKI